MNGNEKTENTLYEISFDNSEPYGIMHEVNQANSEGPIIIAFPGNGFNYNEMRSSLDEKVLRLANRVRKILEAGNVDKSTIKETPFYAISYHTPEDFCEQDARTLLYKKHGRNNIPENIRKGEDGFSEEEQNPAYIESLYDKIIKPRISRLNGKVKTDTTTAARNMAQVVILAHCHGAYTALKLEEVMRKNMQKLGYSKEDILQVQKQMTVVAYAPACPLGVSKMNMVSFKSLNDVSPGEDYNNATVYASIRMDDDRSHWTDINLRHKSNSEFEPFDFKFSFYPDKLGNVFVIKQKGYYDNVIMMGSDGEYFPNRNALDEKEHNNLGAGETEDSKIMFGFMANALANALLHAHKQAQQKDVSAPLSVRELVIGKANPQKDTEIFKAACLAGIEQGAKIEKDITRLLWEQKQQQKLSKK